MKKYNISNILILLIISVILITGCEKEENAQPSVKFSAGSFIYTEDTTTFYKYIDSVLYKITVNDTTPASNLNIPMFADTIFAPVNNKITVLKGMSLFLKFEGKADGIVFFGGDSTRKGASYNYDDYPLAQGVAIELNPNTNVAEESYRYSFPGVYKAQMVATNYWETDADAKEAVKSIEVTVLDNITYNFVAK